jgi:hypothetical protein
MVEHTTEELEEAVEFVRTLRKLLDLQASESTEKLMRSAAMIGASSLLCKEFGAEKVSGMKLVDQVKFLFGIEGVDHPVRRKLALVWGVENLPTGEPSDETIGVITEIQEIFGVDVDLVVRFITGMLDHTRPVEI